MNERVVTDYNEISQVLADRSMRQALYDEGGVVMADCPMTLHGAEHHKRRVLEFSILRKDYFAYYEANVFPPALAQVFCTVGTDGHMDLVDFGYRVTMNLTADFCGHRQAGEVGRRDGAPAAPVKIFSEGATLVHSTRDKEQVRAEGAGRASSEDSCAPPSMRRRSPRRKAALAKGGDDLPRDISILLLATRRSSASRTRWCCARWRSSCRPGRTPPPTR